MSMQPMKDAYGRVDKGGYHDGDKGTASEMREDSEIKERMNEEDGQPHGLSEHEMIPDHAELDKHHAILEQAESIKNNPHIMKHLVPHMENKRKMLGAIMHAATQSENSVMKKRPKNLDELKAVAKAKRLAPDDYHGND